MKYGKKRLFLLLTLLSIAAFLFFSSKVFAQTPPAASSYDVTVSPVYFDLSADPGTTLTSKIRIRNNTSSPIPVKLGVERLTGDLNGNYNLTQDKDDSTLSWITFDSNSVVTQPLEWTEIPFSINIPQDAAYGYYWTITFAQDNTSPLAKNGVTLSGAAAVPILLDVRKAGAKSEGKIAEFATDSPFYEYLPTKFNLKVQNTGNVHIQPKGSIFIKDWLGRQVAVLNINSEQRNILPNSARKFENSWDDGFITIEPKIVDGQQKVDKNGKPETSLKIRWDKILDLKVGRYTASELVIISTATKDLTYQQEVSFWVFPWKLIGGILLFIVFAAIGFYSTLKNLTKKVFALLGTKTKNKEV